MAASRIGKRGEIRKPRLLDEVRAKIRARHYSRRSEGSYTQRVKRFIL